MTRRKKPTPVQSRRRHYSDEFKAEAVQMLLDGHTAPSVVARLGISNVNMLYPGRRNNLFEVARWRVLWKPESRNWKANCVALSVNGEKLKGVRYFRPQRIADVYAAVETTVSHQLLLKRAPDRTHGPGSDPDYKSRPSKTVETAYETAQRV